MNPESVIARSEATRQSMPPDPLDGHVADAPFHAQPRHCERSEAIHDSGLHGLPRSARSDEGSVQGPCAVSG
ncbi:hypothetical protein, partial [Rhodoferax sp.]|uniref:hypothetical protein n=1 Tax=Rhodoferax sp. TaxID=50421 RepID=UPI003BB7B239